MDFLGSAYPSSLGSAAPVSDKVARYASWPKDGQSILGMAGKSSVSREDMNLM